MAEGTKPTGFGQKLKNVLGPKKSKTKEPEDKKKEKVKKPEDKKKDIKEKKTEKQKEKEKEKKNFIKPKTVETTKSSFSIKIAIFFAYLLLFGSIALNIMMFIFFKSYRDKLALLEKAIVKFYCTEQRYTGCNLKTIMNRHTTRQEAAFRKLLTDALYKKDDEDN